MSQFDLIDDYLTNRLNGGSKHLFEAQMEADPALKAEVDFQKSVIEGIKKARINELKAMMDNVPVGGASALTGKLALAALTVGIIATLTYLRFNPSTENVSVPAPPQTQGATANEPTLPETTGQEEIKTGEKPSEIKTTPKKVNEAAAGRKTITQSAPPKIDVVDPTEELHAAQQESSAAELLTKPLPMANPIEVAIDDTNKTYPFHYQFIADKLVLYGPFNSDLYEVIQINGATQTAFLYYKGKYYHLDEQESAITPLIMIRDNLLLAKLDQYRNKK